MNVKASSHPPTRRDRTRSEATRTPMRSTRKNPASKPTSTEGFFSFFEADSKNSSSQSLYDSNREL
ncbi:MAG: hypothetical protein ACK55Z_30020, partial [bacterium]